MSSPREFVLTSSSSQPSRLGDGLVPSDSDVGFVRGGLPLKIAQQDRERFRQFYDDELQRKGPRQFLYRERLRGGPNKTFQAGEGVESNKAAQERLRARQEQRVKDDQFRESRRLARQREWQEQRVKDEQLLESYRLAKLQDAELRKLRRRRDKQQIPKPSNVTNLPSKRKTPSRNRSAIAKRAIPPLSAGNFVNCLFCQDYPDVLKNLNTVEEAFIARAHVVGIFLKLTLGAKSGISYRGSCGHSVAVRQDPSGLLKILPAARLRDHTTITVSWDRGAPPLEENLARFCSINKAKVVNALIWLCANNPSYNHYIPQEIRDAFLTLGSEPSSTGTPVEDKREGYATSLRDGLFKNELDAEVEDAEPSSILSRSFFSDLYSRDLHSTPATLASL
ncbi:hypothetical protein V498_03526 [Pseudogymnoascus sp. VKM F-4517 (FW-2822)]|nr:hypothetical protein V498_03526 [Pseudogymnoascus sp. VKM F-4517 (FW-2822)]